MKSTLGISEKGTEEISTFLNTLLADEYVLYTKTRNAHWKSLMELKVRHKRQYQK